MSDLDVLMVLPRRTIHCPSEMSSRWNLDKDGGGITAYTEDALLGHAMWHDQDDFGFCRPAITFLSSTNEDIGSLFEALISRLALAYESIPSRWPLYIRLSSSQLELIAKASRMGFVPYFGEWKEHSSDRSENDWAIVTDELRSRFPGRLAA